MKLKTIAPYLDTDELTISSQKDENSIILYEGSEAIQNVIDRYGDYDIKRITPGNHSIDIMLLN